MLAVLITSAGTARAEFDWGAKYAGDYLSGQSSARLLALGGTGVAISSGPSAMLANPAMIFSESNHDLSLMHADRFSSAVKVDHANYIRMQPDGTAIGFGFLRQGVDDISLSESLRDPSLPLSSTNRPVITGSTSASEYAFILAYAREGRYGQLGGTAKLLYKHLYDSRAYGLGIDIGYARSFGGLTVGAQLRDALTTILVWDTGRQEGIVPTVRVGAAYQLEIERLQATILPVVEVVARTETWGNDDFLSVKAGFEYTISHVVSARIGYDEDRLTYGAGLNLGMIAANYAFLNDEDLGAIHRISLRIQWGQH